MSSCRCERLSSFWQLMSSQSKDFSSLKAIIKQSSCLFIWSLNPDIINTGAQLSQAGVHVSKLLVTTLFVEILHGMDFGVVRWRSPKSCMSDTHKYTCKWYFARPQCAVTSACVHLIWLQFPSWKSGLCPRLKFDWNFSGAVHGPD